MTEFDFKAVCPILLHQLVAKPTSIERLGCLTIDQLSNDHHQFTQADNLMAVNEDTTLGKYHLSRQSLNSCSDPDQ